MLDISSTKNDGPLKASLEKMRRSNLFRDLHSYGRRGVDALEAATPVETGLTAGSWRYRITSEKYPGIEWYNTHEVNGTPLVILLQYGHGTGTGGYVRGRDFINPAMRPIFDQIADDVWRRVTNG